MPQRPAVTVRLGTDVLVGTAEGSDYHHSPLPPLAPLALALALLALLPRLTTTTTIIFYV